LELTPARQARSRIVQNPCEVSRPASPQKKPLDVNSLVNAPSGRTPLRRNFVEVDFRRSRSSAVLAMQSAYSGLLNMVTMPTGYSASP